MSFILAIASGLITALTFPTVFGGFHLPNFGFLAWISLVPLFYSIIDSRPRRSFLLTFIAAIFYGGISLSWLYNALSEYGHLSGAVSVGVLSLLIIMVATYAGCALMFASWFEQKLGVNRFWTLPLFWVIFEFARNYTPCNGFPWGSITNTQYAYLPVIQIVDLVGIYGLTYIMIVFNSWIAGIIRGHNPVYRSKQAVIFVTALVSFMLFYGWFRLEHIRKDQNSWQSMRVALVQGNIPQSEKWETGQEEKQLSVHRNYNMMLDKSGIDLIIWPESSYQWLVPANINKLPKEHFGLSDFKFDTYLLMGALSEEKDGNLRNSALLLDKTGDILGRYHKNHLVPFGEYVPYRKFLFFARKLVAPIGDFLAGDEKEPLFTDRFQIGGLVCYEDVFPEISRGLVNNGANILAVITNDAWYGRSSAAYQHLAISVFRAVENRRWLVKAANSGVSAVVDATGRIISKTDIFERGVIVSQAKLSDKKTLYSKYGDFFAWICFGIVVCIMVVGKKYDYRRD
jgi:apolipoprotein N-acyltransferase